MRYLSLSCGGTVIIPTVEICPECGEGPKTINSTGDAPGQNYIYVCTECEHTWSSRV